MVDKYKELWKRLKQVLIDRTKIFRDDQKHCITFNRTIPAMEARNRALACEQIGKDMLELESA